MDLLPSLFAQQTPKQVTNSLPSTRTNSSRSCLPIFADIAITVIEDNAQRGSVWWTIPHCVDALWRWQLRKKQTKPRSVDFSGKLDFHLIFNFYLGLPHMYIDYINRIGTAHMSNKVRMYTLYYSVHPWIALFYDNLSKNWPMKTTTAHLLTKTP